MVLICTVLETVFGRILKEEHQFKCVEIVFIASIYAQAELDVNWR